VFNLQIYTSSNTRMAEMVNNSTSCQSSQMTETSQNKSKLFFAYTHTHTHTSSKSIHFNFARFC